jgi:hypothetical protein
MSITVQLAENGVHVECNEALRQFSGDDAHEQVLWYRVVDIGYTDERARIFFVGVEHGEVLPVRCWLTTRMEPVSFTWATAGVKNALFKTIRDWYVERLERSLGRR